MEQIIYSKLDYLLRLFTQKLNKSWSEHREIRLFTQNNGLFTQNIQKLNSGLFTQNNQKLNSGFFIIDYDVIRLHI